MLQFQDFLSEQDEIRARSEKGGRAIDEAAFVELAKLANKINLRSRKKAPITAARLLEEVDKAKKDKSNPLNFSSASNEFFIGGAKNVAGAKESWYKQLETAAYAFERVAEHPDFAPYLNSPEGFEPLWLGKHYGELTEPWTKRNLKGATATAKTDVAFQAEGVPGIFTASLKDETGGALTTAAGGEAGAIMEVAVSETLKVAKGFNPNSKNGQEQLKYISGQLEKFEKLMGNDANKDKTQKIANDLVEHFNSFGYVSDKPGAPKVPLGEVLLRSAYIEALTASHKFKDKPSIVSHLLKIALGDKAKFQSVDEHLSPFYEPDDDGFTEMLSRNGGYYGAIAGINITFGKHGKRGAQPAAFRIYPMKPAEQKQAWLHTQDDHITDNDFASYQNEFGYEISPAEAQMHWDHRKAVIDSAMMDFNKNKDQKKYNEAVGYKATKEEIKERQLGFEEPPVEEEPEKPEPNDSYAGGDEWLTAAERAVHRKEKPAATITQASKKAVSQVTAKPAAINKSAIKGAVRQAAQPKQAAAGGKNIWAQIEKAYTTTNVPIPEIAKNFNVSVDEIKAHQWQGGWHRPRKQA